jgi:Rap1a immunity proteins
MKLKLAIALLTASSLIMPAFAQEIAIEALAKRCSEKTIVMNLEGQKVGEKLGGYCAGYFSGVLDALKNTPKLECKNKDEKTPEYLLSVFETYVREKKVPITESAAKAAVQAFRRAFDCTAL